MYSYKIIIKKLLKRNISISIAESCTGGLLSSNFTSVAGISKIFNMGLITYSNKAKSNLLKITKNHWNTKTFSKTISGLGKFLFENVWVYRHFCLYTVLNHKTVGIF